MTTNGIAGKARTLNSQPKKSETVSCVKRTASSKYLSSLLPSLGVESGMKNMKCGPVAAAKS